jgi:hypothetical protein
MKVSLAEIRPFIAIVGLVVIIIFSISLALAHDWYPPECCNGEDRGGDCRKVGTEDLQESDKGCWVYLPTGNKFCGAQVRPSQDRYFHVCIGNKPHDRGKSYCAFILQGT